MGGLALQSRRALLDACDQWRTLNRLRHLGLPVPHSVLVRSPAQVEWRSIAGPPWYIKARRGSKGSHVLYATSERLARQQIRFLWGTGLSAIVQEDLSGRGPVRRSLIVHGRALISAVATPAAGEHRSNWHLGGRWTLVDDDSPTAALACKAARCLSLPIAAVDTLGEGDPAILEVNASPGLEGLEQASGRTRSRVIVEPDKLACVAVRGSPERPNDGTVTVAASAQSAKRSVECSANHRTTPTR